ncbi:26S proteasome non-ATPase regulatory subunit 8-like [Tropilaelaps mercedesae]|uniref:26S proteasome non-ATPase regulatory subunit 8-like n=1 Tax=Tropilaelaps mercedesae TaxID=418985 RepID=A0A1V9XMH7_9ACAR|nr:26S proteasome non-ATPase regulatory subunit 8-like [Tropilaelaps mercedesae]
MNLDEVVSCYQLLMKEWNSKGPDYIEKCGVLLNKLKIGLTHCAFLPTTGTANKKELLIARDILEIGAQWSCTARDIPSFERYLAMLKTYYMDYKNELPESSYRFQLLGLNLLCLLAQNRANIHISHPVAMEQFLMEGSYNKIFLSKDDVPAASYTFFMDILLDTVRGEICSCAEKTYEKISASEMARMLYFDSMRAAEAYLAKRGWTLQGGVYILMKPKDRKSVLECNPIPAGTFATKAIEYAREMEQIV